MVRSHIESADLQNRLDELLHGDTPDIAAAVELLLRQGLEARASDIVLEPGETQVDVRIRVDGVMQTIARVPRAVLPNLVNRIKVLAGLLTYRSDLPQEGRIPSEAVDASVEFRVAVYPTVRGPRVAIRIFDPAQKDIALTDLGLPPEIERSMSRIVAAPEGVVLLTGPSGSGKTTTIYALLRHLVRTGMSQQAERTIITIEDPVELTVQGVTQTTINEAAGLDFARALRSLLRQDPDVLVVGEIRDRETARVAMEAGLTGHLVIATIHAGSACGVFSRLLEMDVEPYLLTGAVSMVLAQRLPRRTCDSCRGSLCPTCRWTGFAGRLLLTEAVTMMPALSDGIRQRLDRRELTKIALATGMISLEQRARDAIAAGRTTEEEVARVLAV